MLEDGFDLIDWSTGWWIELRLWRLFILFPTTIFARIIGLVASDPGKHAGVGHCLEGTRRYQTYDVCSNHFLTNYQKLLGFEKHVLLSFVGLSIYYYVPLSI